MPSSGVCLACGTEGLWGTTGDSDKGCYVEMSENTDQWHEDSRALSGVNRHRPWCGGTDAGRRCTRPGGSEGQADSVGKDGGRGALPGDQPPRPTHRPPHTDRRKHMQPTAKQPLLPAMTSHSGSPGQAPEPPRAQPLSHLVGLCQAAISCLPRDPPTWQSW